MVQREDKDMVVCRLDLPQARIAVKADDPRRLVQRLWTDDVDEMVPLGIDFVVGGATRRALGDEEHGIGPGGEGEGVGFGVGEGEAVAGVVAGDEGDLGVVADHDRRQVQFPLDLGGVVGSDGVWE